MSVRIHGSLTAQNNALEDMDNRAQHLQSSLSQVTERTNALVNKAGGPRPFAIIGCLTCTAFVLLLLVIYT